MFKSRNFVSSGFIQTPFSMRIFTLLLALLLFIPANVQSASYPSRLSVLSSPQKAGTPPANGPGDLDEMVENVQKATKLSLTFVLITVLAVAGGYGLIFLGVGAVNAGIALLGLILLTLSSALGLAALVFLVLGLVAMLVLKSKLDTIGDPNLTEEYMLKTRRARNTLIVMTVLYVLSQIISVLGFLLVG